MELPLALVAVFLSLSVVFIGLFIALKVRGGQAAKPRNKATGRDGPVAMVTASDTGGSRKGTADADRHDGGSEGGDGGGDGGGGGGD